MRYAFVQEKKIAFAKLFLVGLFVFLLLELLEVKVAIFFFLKVLALPMLAPKSYTREDVVELQCHGSEVCLRRVLKACLEAGARLAEPGWV